ncbi:MAG: 4-alpha-glucanotransferase [Deltaproteobacteria bacterium]|nr:4-alpha-glucanotransferase [Deltaproteobacteria bacterium]
MSDLDDARRALGISRLVLAIHDVSFPAAPGEDTGRGSPYSRGAQGFFEFVRALGFDGVQLGPQGQTSPGNMSPYDGSVFSKSVLSLPIAELAGPRYAHLLGRAVVDDAVGRAPPGDRRAHYAHAWVAHHGAVVVATARLRMRAAGGDADAIAIAREVEAFARSARWLEHDARFEAFSALHHTDDFRQWPERDRRPSEARVAEVEAGADDLLEAYRFGQWALAREHAALRERLAPLGLRLYGDLQIGISLRDRWMRDDLFLRGWAMGAPPSRTNPEGQPWGYPVFDPSSYLRVDGPPLAFVRARIAKMWGELDGVRIDHPHGLVCPWVYEADAPEPYEAVRSGARLFESPEHPSLGRYAIARADQIDATVPPFHDSRVKRLEAAQIDAYARLLDVLVGEARAHGRSEDDVLCEVLSTCPLPIYEVMRRFGLGRFRVTQKASMTDPTDGYRGENAEARDWTMIGNHDTDPILRVMDRWRETGQWRARADYLATRLEPSPERRGDFAARLAGDPREMLTAMFAELFVGPAANVLVFWADLFGERDVYNTPGVVRPENWTLRVPSDYRAVYAERVARGEAPDLRAALAMAKRARGMG